MLACVTEFDEDISEKSVLTELKFLTNTKDLETKTSTL